MSDLTTTAAIRGDFQTVYDRVQAEARINGPAQGTVFGLVAAALLRAQGDIGTANVTYDVQATATTNGLGTYSLTLTLNAWPTVAPDPVLPSDDAPPADHGAEPA